MAARRFARWFIAALTLSAAMSCVGGVDRFEQRTNGVAINLVINAEPRLANLSADQALSLLRQERRTLDTARTALRLADGLIALERFEDAQLVLDWMERERSLSAEAEVRSARILIAQQRFGEAVSILRTVVDGPAEDLTLPPISRAPAMCELAFAQASAGDRTGAEQRFIRALEEYVSASAQGGFFVGDPECCGTYWDAALPPLPEAAGPAIERLAQLQALGWENRNPNYWSDAYSAFLGAEYLRGFPNLEPFVTCLERVGQFYASTQRFEIAAQFLDAAVAQSSPIGVVSLGADHEPRHARSRLLFIELLEVMGAEPERLSTLSDLADYGLAPAFSAGDVTGASRGSRSSRLETYRALSAIQLRSIYRLAEQGVTNAGLMEDAFLVSQKFDESSAALAVYTHFEGRTHPRLEGVSEEEHRAYWNQFDDDIPGPANFQEIELGDDQVLIFITPGIDQFRGRIWVVSNEERLWAPMGSDRHTIRRQIDELRCMLDVALCQMFDADSDMGRAFRALNARAPSGSFKESDFDASAAHQLFLDIFADARVRALALSHHNWIIVPQGELLSLPFAALPIAEPLSAVRHRSRSKGFIPNSAAARAYRATEWLGTERAVSIFPSVRSFVSHRIRDEEPREVELFAVGNPVYGPNGGATASAGCNIRTLGRRRSPAVETRGVGPAIQLRSLPGTDCEIRALQSLFTTSVTLLGGEATEGAVRNAASVGGPLGSARILSFATHGIIAEQGLSSEPALVLTHARSGLPAVSDGLLTASEIAQLNMRADVVFLSACNTGSAGARADDALAGFARGFFQAGARSVFVTQWSVRDDVAARLTPRVVALSQGASTRAPCERGAVDQRSHAEALRIAMCELLHDGQAQASSPGDWAPFVLVGEAHSNPPPLDCTSDDPAQRRRRLRDCPGPVE